MRIIRTNAYASDLAFEIVATLAKHSQISD